MWLPNPRALSFRFHSCGQPGSLYLSIARISLGNISPLENILLSSSVVSICSSQPAETPFRPSSTGVQRGECQTFPPGLACFNPSNFLLLTSQKEVQGCVKWAAVSNLRESWELCTLTLVLDFAVFQFSSMERWWQVMPGVWIFRVWIPCSKALFRSPCKWNGLK